MKLLAALATAVTATNCPPQRSTGIDQNGDSDPSNTNICYPLKNAAVVSRCNDSDGRIEMAISIHQDLLSEAPSDDFVKNDDTNTWDAVFEPADLTAGGTLDYLEYSKSFMLNGASVNVGGVDVKTTVGSNTKFSCKYMMGEQIVKEKFNVSGTDTIKSREGFGTLGYILEVTNDDTVPLGDVVYYRIRPLNPTIVHARAILCGVENDSPTDTSGQELVHLIKKPIKYFDSCKQEAIDLEVIKGWGGQTNQEFSYQSFKWSTSAGSDNPETHTIVCTIELSREGWLSDLGQPLTFEEWCGEYVCDADDEENKGVIGSKTGQYRLEPISGSWPYLDEDKRNKRRNPVVLPIDIKQCAVHDEYSSKEENMTKEQMFEVSEQCKVDYCRRRCFFRQQRWEQLKNGEFHLKYFGKRECNSDAQCNFEDENPIEWTNYCEDGWCKDEFDDYAEFWINEHVSYDYVVENAGYFSHVDNGCRYFAVHNLEKMTAFNFQKHYGSRAHCLMWVDTPVNFVEDDTQPELTINTFESECFQNRESVLEATMTTTATTATTYASPLPDIEM